MNFIKNLSNYLREKPHLFGAYILTLNYVEVIHYLFISVVFLGKPAAVLSGLFFLGLITASILFIYFKISATRMIILVFADLHAAFSIIFLIFSFTDHQNGHLYLQHSF